MTKEDIIEILKHLILQLRDHSKELQADPRLMKDFVAKSEMIKKEVDNLTPLDKSWVDKEYSKWHVIEIIPKL